MQGKLFGWDDVADIRHAFLEGYGGKVNEPEATSFAADMAGLIVGVLDSWTYEEAAHFIFERGGKLFEVTASHCSCDGFEGRWEPEEISWEQLAMRPAGWISYDTEEACEYIEEIVKQRVAERAVPPTSYGSRL
jgi:hypothetical protein